MKKTLLAILFIFLFSVTKAQIFEDDENYTQEWVWGINKNTNSGILGGFVLRYSQILRKNYFQTFSLELINVKHPNEVRFTSTTGGRFIFGKTDYLYSIRLQYGRDKIIFKKATQNGVQINVMGAIGPTIGLLSPYYVLNASGKYEKFNINTHVSPQSIASSGKIFQGLNESKAKFGLNAKMGMAFEFGTYKGAVTGIEIGFLLEAFTEKIIIIPTQKNKAIFSSFYFTIFRGRRR